MRTTALHPRLGQAAGSQDKNRDDAATNQLITYALMPSRIDIDWKVRSPRLGCRGWLAAIVFIVAHPRLPPLSEPRSLHTGLYPLLSGLTDFIWVDQPRCIAVDPFLSQP